MDDEYGKVPARPVDIHEGKERDGESALLCALFRLGVDLLVLDRTEPRAGHLNPLCLKLPLQLVDVFTGLQQRDEGKADRRQRQRGTDAPIAKRDQGAAALEGGFESSVTGAKHSQRQSKATRAKPVIGTIEFQIHGWKLSSGEGFPILQNHRPGPTESARVGVRGFTGSVCKAFSLRAAATAM